MTKNLAWFVLLVFIVSACGIGLEIEPLGQETFGDQTAEVEEIRFRSGGFRLVGELRLPPGDGPFPAVVLVHGSGGATRDGAVNFRPLIELFLRNGYAVLSWDKPGSGESTGDFESGHTLTGRAEILADGVQALTEHPNIDAARIGAWGVSQAGWVIPLALEMTEGIAFMIVVGGGAEDSIEQMAYQVGQQVACAGGTEDEVALTEELWPLIATAQTYEEYRQAVETLLEMPGLRAATGLEFNEEDNWSAWPTDIDAFFDPMEVISHTTIPMLILFGELDKNIDPVQGAQAYQDALDAIDNTSSEVVVISGAGHVLTSAETGCLGEPSGPAYVPEYLEVLEAWLQALDM